MKANNKQLAMLIVGAVFLLSSCGEDADSFSIQEAAIEDEALEKIETLMSLREIDIPPRFSFDTVGAVALKISSVKRPSGGWAFVAVKTAEEKVVYQGAIKSGEEKEIRLALPLSAGRLFANIRSKGGERSQTVEIFKEGYAILKL